MVCLNYADTPEETAGFGLPDRIADGNLARSDRTVKRWFDPTAFAPPAQEIGRASCRERVS